MSTSYPIPLGALSRRTHGAEAELRERAASAYKAAIEAEAAGQVHFGASLRGKAQAYREAADVVRALDRGRRIPKRPRWRP